MAVNIKTGTLYGVGLGPGDPELLTLKAARVLSTVAVVFAPTAREDKQSYALEIIEGLERRPDQIVVKQVFPMTKDADVLNRSWRLACQEIREHLNQGRDCAFITEGDPMIYSTFSYVLEYFEKFYPEINVEVIPGISCFNATAARARVPLCKEGQKLAIYPVGYDDRDLGQVLDEFDTVALYKTYRAKDRILDIIKPHCAETGVVFAEKVTRPDERIIKDMRLIEMEDMGYFSMLLLHRDLDAVHRDPDSTVNLNRQRVE
jgi:precorrin-2/cobalt-factor-2 C20-methyltransferase